MLGGSLALRVVALGEQTYAHRGFRGSLLLAPQVQPNQHHQCQHSLHYGIGGDPVWPLP